jgi:hypothetical protein
MEKKTKKGRMSDVKKELYELKRQTQERFLSITGVDVKKLRALEKGVDDGYRRLADETQKLMKAEGKERAEKHARTLELKRTSIRENAESLTTSPLMKDLKIMDYRDTAVLKYIRWPFRICLNYAPIFSLDNGDDVVIDPPNGNDVGNVTYDGPTIAKPYVSVHGGGIGTSDSVRLNTYFKFAFTPTSDGSYCISPHAMMNGWWLLWVWGNCQSTASGSGTLSVKLKVKVEQLADPVKEIEHTVLEKNSATMGMVKEAAVDYNSITDGGASMVVYLKGGHEAIIFVECEIEANINDYGRAIVDMQSGSGFYFTVPEVYISRCYYYWPWWWDIFKEKLDLFKPIGG